MFRLRFYFLQLVLVSEAQTSCKLATLFNLLKDEISSEPNLSVLWLA